MIYCTLVWCRIRTDLAGPVINWPPGSGHVKRVTDPRIRIRKKYLQMHDTGYYGVHPKDRAYRKLWHQGTTQKNN
jgi:hypothetical protein